MGSHKFLLERPPLFLTFKNFCAKNRCELTGKQRHLFNSNSICKTRLKMMIFKFFQSRYVDKWQNATKQDRKWQGKTNIFWQYYFYLKTSHQNTTAQFNSMILSLDQHFHGWLFPTFAQGWLFPRIDFDQRLPSWQPLLPSLDLRFDPVQAFSHNGALFVLGYQTALQNFAFKFDPVRREWRKLLESFSGHFVNEAGILLRAQKVNKAFFPRL